MQTLRSPHPAAHPAERAERFSQPHAQALTTVDTTKARTIPATALNRWLCSQPPPPLPDYDQPPAPGDGYLWTPGYWGYSPSGYYWVPGGWVQAPYQGALWTPGYWGYRHNRYGFYRGYWGPHIGYYGGVNYGFGYIGFGYQGGYWGGGHFNYNRSYNNVNVSIEHNVYDRPGRDDRRAATA
jgi:hypothetical protein